MESVDVFLTLTPNTLLCDGYTNVEVVIASLCEGAQGDLYQYESAVNVSTGEVQILSRARTTPVNDTAKFDVSWQTHCLFPVSESSASPIPADEQSAAVSVQPQSPHSSDENEQLAPPYPPRSLSDFSESPSPRAHLSQLATTVDTVMLGFLLIACLARLSVKCYMRCMKVHS
jgi:hypothetical protein